MEALKDEKIKLAEGEKMSVNEGVMPVKLIIHRFTGINSFMFSLIDFKTLAFTNSQYYCLLYNKATLGWLCCI
ncbi:hypothetical protein [Mucilaginibacter sp.]|uniref:hypothetical protein n=1 Tax=Mucilaginibacter sp. TaxID=1882438 RepID=UPI00263A062B|nr:hypothetical protein [Mucilaginibacter sp.]MDB4923300.1 hypothetical protein [Mucilaginibacter sp.]